MKRLADSHLKGQGVSGKFNAISVPLLLDKRTTDYRVNRWPIAGELHPFCGVIVAHIHSTQIKRTRFAGEAQLSGDGK